MLITIPHTFQEERQYILHVLLQEFLSIDYQVESSTEVEDYHFEINGKKLIIKSSFWQDEEYLSRAYIPGKVSWMISPFDESEKIPVIYGQGKIEGNTCYADVFASAFFMLTRWEEYVIEDRDEHNRFPVEASLAYQQGFLHVPVVNMYVELLWQLLVEQGYEGKRRQRAPSLVNTHDVDIPFIWQKPKNVLGRLKFHLIVSKKPWLWITQELPSLLRTLTGISKDPVDTYDYLMDWSEKAGTKSYFFFMDYGHTNFDKYYRVKSRRMQKVLNNIKNRGHHIGFHPSYALYKDVAAFKEAKNEVQNVVGESFEKIGRQHYLRFEVPATWQVWEDAGMEWDSTLSYPSVPGFRCGVCYPYPVFNILTRLQLKLKERPLILMEQSSIQYLKHSPEAMEKKALQLISQVKKYNGEFVMVWHNSSFNVYGYKKYKVIFEKILSQFIS